MEKSGKCERCGDPCYFVNDYFFGDTEFCQVCLAEVLELTKQDIIREFGEPLK
jgi:hypothetical protein